VREGWDGGWRCRGGVGGSENLWGFEDRLEKLRMRAETRRPVVSPSRKFNA